VILTVTSARWEPGLLFAGILLLLAVCTLSFNLAAHEWGDRARPPIVRWAIGGPLGFYLLISAAAGLACPEYAVAGLLAGLIPPTAVCPAGRAGTVEDRKDRGRLHDESAHRGDEPYAGTDMDDRTPAWGHARAFGCTASAAWWQPLTSAAVTLRPGAPT
jgi:hypothetical protein